MVVEVVFTGLVLLVYPSDPADRPQSIDGKNEFESNVEVLLLKTDPGHAGGEVHHHVPRLNFLAEQYADGIDGLVVDAARQVDGDLVVSVDLTDQRVALGAQGGRVQLHFPDPAPDVSGGTPGDPSALDFLLPIGSLGLVNPIETLEDHLSARVSLHGGSIEVTRLARQGDQPALPRPLMRLHCHDGTRAIAEQFIWRINVEDGLFDIRRLGTTPIRLERDEENQPIRFSITNVPKKAEMSPPDLRHLSVYGRLFQEPLKPPKTPGQVSNTSGGCPPAQGGGKLECLSCYPQYCS